jgi:transcriptional regulator with XRE-family HTH domain
MVPQAVVFKISQQIRSTRLKKKMTIQQLADRTRVTKGLLSKIENARTLPSLPVLIQIIQSLEMPVNEFFNEIGRAEDDRQCFVIRKEEYANISGDNSTGTAYRHIFSQDLAASLVQFQLISLAGDLKFSSEITDGFIFNFIVRGNCKAVIARETAILHEGDSIYFASQCPHHFMRDTGPEVMMLSVHFNAPAN